MTSIIGVDLALENTGLAVVKDGQLSYLGSFSTKLKKADGEARYLDRVESWLTQARVELSRCKKAADAHPVVVYENRPFLLAKHRQGHQSQAAVLSYSEALGLLRVVLLEQGLRDVQALSPAQWQTAILDGFPLSNSDVDEAEKHLSPGTKRIKAMVLAAVHRQTGVWPENDHAADATAIALTAWESVQNLKGESCGQQ
jgi:Holliday junction resolvasome, endonuclease subunit